MGGPAQLARPLAARVARVPAPVEWTAGPDLPPAVIQAAAEALDAGKTKYTDRPGILPLRQWVADSLNDRYRLALSPDDVTITCGGTEARFVAVKTLVLPDSLLLCPGDDARIAGAAALAGASVVARADDPAAVRVLYLAAHDSGLVLASWLAQARAHGWWIIWDMGQAGEAAMHPAQDAALASHVVTIGSLSAHLPGWRIGWLAGSERAQQLRAYKQSMTICSPSISQWAALGWVEGQ